MRETTRMAAALAPLVTSISILVAAAPCDAVSSRFLQAQFPQVGARYAAMGGGHVALPGGLAGGYWNPALLSRSHHFEALMEGSFTSGPSRTTMEGINSLRVRNQATFGAVGALFPGERGFDYGFIEVTRYEHDMSGFLFDSERNRGLNTEANPDGGKAIIDYTDRTTIRSFGLLTGYRSGENHSVGLGIWFDRKKVFKDIDYITDCAPSDGAIAHDFLDKEASTNDITVRFSAGGFLSVTPRFDLGLAVQSSSNLQSTLNVDRWSTCTPDQELTAVVEEQTPTTVQAGCVFRKSENLLFAGDLVYEKWGVLADHDDVTQIRLGTEWTAAEHVDLRAGFYTAFDPVSLGSDEARAERLRDVQWSGNLDGRDDFFLTFGVGYEVESYLALDASIEDSHLTSSQSGQFSARIAFRLIAEDLEE